MHGNPYAADSEVMASILDEAVRILDEKFGLDYAKKNPLLLSKLAEIGAANYARRSSCSVHGFAGHRWQKASSNPKLYSEFCECGVFRP